MKQRKPMNRTQFRRARKDGPTVPDTSSEWSPSPRRTERPSAVMARCDSTVRAIPKEAVVRCEEYRRLVAARPCKRCGRIGRSQAAHPPPTGKAIKQDDRLCFPLCADELLRAGCHPRFDQYELYPHDIALRWAAKWGRETRAEILAEGAWPPALELFDEASA